MTAPKVDMTRSAQWTNSTEESSAVERKRCGTRWCTRSGDRRELGDYHDGVLDERLPRLGIGRR